MTLYNEHGQLMTRREQLAREEMRTRGARMFRREKLKQAGEFVGGLLLLIIGIGVALAFMVVLPD